MDNAEIECIVDEILAPIVKNRLSYSQATSVLEKAQNKLKETGICFKYKHCHNQNCL